MDRVVSVLRPSEPARFDPGALEDLCRDMGEAEAEALVARSLEEISEGLEALRQVRHGGHLVRRRRQLDTVVVAAGRIGMTGLADVGHAVQRALARGDQIVLAATMARLLRIGDRSIQAIWDLEDVSV